MSSWVSQGVLLGATGATGATGPAGGQSTTTTSSFTMPALNGTVAIAVVSAAWTKLGQTLFINDGTHSGFWEITTRTSATALTVTNRGYTGNATSGTMATAATVQLIGPGIASATAPGFIPKMGSGAAALTTFASFVIPSSLGSTTGVTVGSALDIGFFAQLHYLTDGAGNWMVGNPTSLAGLVVQYTCLATNVLGATMGAGRVYFGAYPVNQDQQDVTIPTSNAASLISSNTTTPGYLNDLVGSSLVVVTPPAGGTPPFGSGLITLSLNAPTSGNATSGQVVLGNDTRLKTFVPWQKYNAIRNPEMIVAQRGTSIAAIASGAYGLDGWIATLVGTMVATVTQNAAAIPADTSGNNWYPYTPYAHRVTFTTGQASLSAGQVFLVSQRVEGLLAEQLKNNPTSISLLVRSSITGTFTVSLRDSLNGFSYVNTGVISSANTWTRITIPNIPTFSASGTFPDGTGLCYSLSICMGSGSTFLTSTVGSWTAGNFVAATGQTNFAATTSNTFDFTLVQHEPNSVCTPYVKRELAAENALGQRYLWMLGSINLGVIYTSAFTYSLGLLTFPTPMRAAPTLTIGSVIGANTGSAGTAGLSGPTAYAASVYNTASNWTVGSSATFNGGFTAEL